MKAKVNKFRCPYCYELHSVYDCLGECKHNIHPTDKKCMYGTEKDDNGYVKKEYIKKCLKCTEAAFIHYCPHKQDEFMSMKYNNDGFEIPSSYLDSKNQQFTIALLGAKYSGKSNYISVLVEEIAKKLTQSFDCAILPSNDNTSKIYRENYYGPVYIDKRVTPATTSGVVPPLLYRIIFQNGRKEKTISLTFYDTAGEDLNKYENVVEKGYIANADGIIVLLDPLQVPSIREKLAARNVELPAMEADPLEIVSKVLRIFREVKNIKNKIKVPIALAFSKMDVLEDCEDIIGSDSFYKEESEHLDKKAFVLSDFMNTQYGMEGILDSCHYSNLMNAVRQFNDYSYFGISALGSNPDREGHLYGGVRPRRALDPLLWLLAKKKIIRTIK